MDDLAERIKASIEDPNSDPWFPQLTADLTARAWDCLHRDLGLTPDTYGTERVLSRSTSAPREVIASLKTCSSTCPTASAISIEALAPECAIQYQKRGVNFYSSEEILHTPVLSCIEEALAIINQVPSLMRTVAALVRSLHVIKPGDEDHDVSFSEPHVPFSIFVSVPEKRIASDGLRVAEAIVHESMHLQLTFIQHMTPLIGPTADKYYSPWRRQFRNPEGVLQAIYVFKTIYTFFQALNSTSNDAIDNRAIRRRRLTIMNQLKGVTALRDSKALTSTGVEFVEWLMK